MPTLNLISPTKKQELKLTQIYLIVKNLIISILFFATILAIILLLTKLALQNHFQRIVVESSLNNKYANTFNVEVRQFNDLIKAVTTIQKDHINWVAFMVNIANSTPAGVNIKSLIIDQTKQVCEKCGAVETKSKILIKGFANSRQDLLELKNNLEESSIFENVELPIDDLLQKNNIDFDLKANIVKEEI